MKLTGAKIIAEALKQEKIDTIFGYPGGAVIKLFDELYRNREKIKIISPRHEQAGTHAADGYARATGKVGVVIVTSGPGATNTVTGIATAYMDSVPLVVITGQVPTHMIGTDAFQEVDITGITSPITKANFLITDVGEISNTLKLAFYLAKSGRPGPVLVDIPSDVQKAETDFVYPENIDIKSYRPKEKGHPWQIKKAIELIKFSKKPLIICGGGVNIANAMDGLNNLINKLKIPVVHTLQGHGVNPKNEDLYYGGIGMHGTLYGNYAVQNADLIIAFGVRFSDRILGDKKSFAVNAKIIHVDIDPAEIGKNIKVDVPIVGNLKNVIKEFLKIEIKELDFSSWLNELKVQKTKNPMRYKKDGKLKPQYLIELANRFFKEDTIVVSDVGQNQMWVSQFYRFKYPRTFLSSGGLGTMGYALPAGIGAKIGVPEREVLVVTGDGGFQMNIQELMTVKRYNLNLKILIIDNSSLGMVRQWQNLFFGKRYSATSLEDNPSFSKLAEDIGIKGTELRKIEDAEKVIKELANSKEAMLVHAKISPDELVLPMVPPGASISNAITEER